MFEALGQQCPRLQVICCADTDWPAPALISVLPAHVRTVVHPSVAEIDALIDEAPGATLHVFSGLRWVPTIVAALRGVRRRGASFAVMSEPRVREGLGGAARWAQSWLTEGWLRRRVAFVLAQGRHGVPWFRSVGYPAERIFPYAYFVEPLDVDGEPEPYRRGCPVRVGYVGRLVRAKGVFQLLYAVAALGPAARLSVVGSGADEVALRAIAPNVDFRGSLPNAAAVAFMRDLDVLVLPSLSTDDGWGVVVSEALMQGTAVIASTAVGASLLLDEPLFGRHVRAGSGEALAHAIIDLRDAGEFSAPRRALRQQRARALLSAQAGARHLLEIVRWSQGAGPRPAAFHLEGCAL